MYRVSPFTYLVGGLLSNAVANAPVTCADNEFNVFNAPPGSTCGEYIGALINQIGGYLADPNATDCQYCAIDNTNTFLRAVSIDFDNRWRDFGVLLVYIVFNIFAAAFIYWFARVPKGRKFHGKNKEDSGLVVQTKRRASQDVVIGGTEVMAHKVSAHEKNASSSILNSDTEREAGREEQVLGEKVPESTADTLSERAARPTQRAPAQPAELVQDKPDT